ncbi:MAG TPA: ComEC/Rec2 family competence protein [Mycobacteriales bacterium]|jgi:competence protein ComEC
MGVFALGVWAAVLLSLAQGRAVAVAAVCAGAGVAAVSLVATGGAGGGAGFRRLHGHGAAGRIVAVAALGVAAGGGSCGLALAVRDGGPVPALAAERAAVRVDAVVRDDPRPIRASPTGQRSWAVPVRVTALTRAGETTAVGGRLLVLTTDPAWRSLLPGQRVLADGRLAPARGGDLTAGVLDVRGPPDLLGDPAWYQRVAGRLRAGLQQACTGLPDDPGSLLPGLVVGDVSRLSPSVEDAFRQTGMTHLVAVSGSNCAIIVGAILALLRVLRLAPRARPLVAGVALVGFVVLVRPSPSVLRAAAMGAVALLALATGRSRAALPALATTTAVLLLVDPALARTAGFVLSVVATLGLVVLAPRWRDGLRARGVPVVLAESLAVPAAAQVACAPVVAALFGTVGFAAVPANLLAVPAVAPATVLGVLAALVSPAAPWLAAALAWLASWPAWWLVCVARSGAGLPGGSVTWPAGVLGGLVLAALLLAAVCAVRVRILRLLAVVAAAALVLVALPIRIVAPGWPPDGWRIVGCSVGQGDAEVLRAGPGAAVVVDTGPEPGAVDACLRRLRISAVPLLVLSHLHADHVGGLEGALRGRVVGAIVTSGYALPAAGAHVLDQAVRRLGLRVVRAGLGAVYRAGDVRLEVIGPVRRFTGTRSDPNNNSLVLRADVAGTSVLLTGDAEHDAQEALLSTGTRLRADVLKVPHHGSAFSAPAFLDAAAASVALIEVGLGNDYGHPSEVVVAHLRRGGARVVRTDLDGDVAVMSRSGRLAVATRGPDHAARSP